MGHKHEAPEIEAMIKRMMRGLVRRAHRGDTQALEALSNLEAFTGQAMTVALAAAHEDQGGIYSWAELGQALGQSRQGVRQRAGRAEAVPDRAWLRVGIVPTEQSDPEAGQELHNLD